MPTWAMVETSDKELPLKKCYQIGCRIEVGRAPLSPSRQTMPYDNYNKSF